MSLILEKPSNIKKIDSPYLNNLKRENIKKEDEEKIIMEGFYSNNKFFFKKNLKEKFVKDF